MLGRQSHFRLPRFFLCTTVGRRTHIIIPFLQVKIGELHAAVPKQLFEKDTFKGLLYVARDVLCAVIIYKLGWLIEPFTDNLISRNGLPQIVGTLLKWTAWGVYWFSQSVALAGWWCLAHEAGHGNISPHKWVNHLVGFSLHTVRIALLSGVGFLKLAFTVRSSSLLFLESDASCSSQSNDVYRTR